MAPSMSPAKMAVARVITHKDFEREVLLALEEFGLFEFIDVRHQVGIAEIELTSDEEAAQALLDRLTHIVNSLGLDVTRGIGQFVEIDDSNISNALHQANNVLKAIEAEVLDIDRDMAMARVELERHKNVRDVALSLEPLGLALDRIGVTEYTYTAAGVVPQANLSKLEWSIKEVSEGTYAMRSVIVKRGKAVASVTVPAEMKNAVDRIFSALGFEPLAIPEGSEGTPEKIIADSNAEIERLSKEVDLLERRRRLIAKEWGPRILAAWELMEIERQRIEARKYVVYTKQAMKVWGWIPEKKAPELEEILRRRIGNVFEMKIEHPDFVEYDSPTYLDNPKFMKATEEVVGAYGVPSHHDLDPTKIMWLTFPLIFGLIFADVGQGFLILLIGIAAWNSKRKGQDWGPILGYLQTGASGLITMGVFAMLGGFLFGSFFGVETAIQPLWPIFAHTLEDGSPNIYRTAHLLKLSIEVGVLQMSMGIVLNLYNRLKHREYREAIVAFSYLWTYLGFVNLLFGVSANSVSAWFDPDGTVNLWVPILGIGYGTGNNGVYPLLPMSAQMFTLLCLVLPLAIMTVTSLMGKMDGLVEYLEYSIGMISHTVSYARIFALNTVHLILSSMFVQMLPALIEIPVPPISVLGVEIVPPQVWEHGVLVEPYIPLLGALVGTIVVGILEGLLAFMHTLRLHFVEWFSKFYHAGGTPFRPYAVSRLFTRPVNEPVAQAPLLTN